MKKISALATLMCSAAALTQPSAAFAQDAKVEPVGFGDIVVTAQKREQNIQDVPISISALSADQLEAKGVVSIDQLTTVPNVKIGRSPTSKTASQIAMRGSVTINASTMWEPAVGVYVDGVYVSKAQGQYFDAADLERIEVLRGPQGTLYGRNTLAGAVNLITKKPTGEFGGSGEISYGNYNYMRAKASIDLPRMGIFSSKIAGQITKRDGIIDLAPGSAYKDTDDLDSKTFLFQTHADFTDAFTADYSYTFNDVDQRPQFAQLYSVNKSGDARDIFDPSSPGYPFGGAFFPLDPLTNTKRQDNGASNVATFERSRTNAHSLTLTLEMDRATLKSISSYRTLKWGDLLDLDGTALPVAQTERNTSYHGYSQEIQLAGKELDEKLNYVIGAFYFNEKAETLGPQSFFGGGANYQSDYGGHTEAYALYGQADYDLTDALTFTLGARYTHEEKDARRYLLAADASTGFVPFVVANFDYGQFSKKFENFSPAASLNYKVNDDVNVYGRYAKGYKSGGYNGETNAFFQFTASCPSGATELCEPYKPEKVDSFEVGVKTRLFDRRLTFNAAAFHDIHKGLQVSVFEGTGAVASLVRNAAKATINGIELDADFMPIPSLVISASGSYLDPKYDSYLDRGVDVSDNRAFAHSPKYTASLSADWRVFQAEWGRLNLSGDYSYQSSFYTAPVALKQPAPTDPDYGYWAGATKAPSQGTLNLRAALSEMKFQGVETTLSIWGKNVADSAKPNNFIDFGPGFGGLRVAFYQDPATYGVTLAGKF